MAVTSIGVYMGYREATEDEITAEKVILTSGVKPTEFTWLDDIKDTPDMGSTPETIDTTTLSNRKYNTNEDGLQNVEGHDFTVNWNHETKNKIDALTKPQVFCVCYPDCSCDLWIGKPKYWRNGVGVNGVVEATLHTSAMTETETPESYYGVYYEGDDKIYLSTQKPNPLTNYNAGTKSS